MKLRHCVGSGRKAPGDEDLGGVVRERELANGAVDAVLGRRRTPPLCGRWVHRRSAHQPIAIAVLLCTLHYQKRVCADEFRGF